MAVENEEMSLAVCNLLQAIIDALSGEDKREHRGKEEALVLGRRQASVLVPGGGWRPGSVSYHLGLGVAGGGLVLFYFIYFLYPTLFHSILSYSIPFHSLPFRSIPFLFYSDGHIHGIWKFPG